MVDHTRLQPGIDLSPEWRVGVELAEQGGVVNAVEAFGYISIQHPFGLLVDAHIDCSNRIPGRASWSKSVAVGFKTRFPLGLKRHFHQRLEGSVEDGRDA